MWEVGEEEEDTLIEYLDDIVIVRRVVKHLKNNYALAKRKKTTRRIYIYLVRIQDDKFRRPTSDGREGEVEEER